MAIRPILIDKQSPFLGEACALCKEPFAPGQEIIICPEDATRHHIHCWRMNNNRCSAYGCNGQGRPILRTPFTEEEDDEVLEAEVLDAEVIQPGDSSDSKVRTLPSGGISCAQSCLILAIALSILIFAVSCFGLWAMLDYILIEILHWQYRAPLSSLPSLELVLRHTGPLAEQLLSSI